MTSSTARACPSRKTPHPVSVGVFTSPSGPHAHLDGAVFFRGVVAGSRADAGGRVFTASVCPHALANPSQPELECLCAASCSIVALVSGR